MAGMESLEWYQPHENHVFYTIPLTPFQPLLGAVLPSAASTGVCLCIAVFGCVRLLALFNIPARCLSRGTFGVIADEYTTVT